jgi:hypothetical protein
MPEVEHWRDVLFQHGEKIEKFTYIRYERGKVVDFVHQRTINQEGHSDGERLIIRRYDCAHGFPHCDIYNAKGRQIRKIPLIANSLDEANIIADADLRQNARRYVEEFRATVEDKHD